MERESGERETQKKRKQTFPRVTKHKKITCILSSSSCVSLPLSCGEKRARRERAEKKVRKKRVVFVHEKRKLQKRCCRAPSFSSLSLLRSLSLSSPLSLFSTPNAQRKRTLNHSLRSLSQRTACKKQKQTQERKRRTRASRAEVSRPASGRAQPTPCRRRGRCVFHIAQVPDRLKDRHEHVIREVGDGKLGAGVAVERHGELAGVERFGHCSVASMLLGERRFFSPFFFFKLAEGATETL